MNLIIRYSILFALVCALALGAYSLYLFFNTTPIINKRIVEYSSPLTTQVFDKKGQLIANLFDKEHRLFVAFQDIPAPVIEALVATEDTSFFEHNGVNIEAIFRAIIKDIKAGGFVEGASTLTQQLIKLTLLSREKTLTRKFKEAIFALRLETLTTKNVIMERYLNEVYFGNGYFGIRTASEGYFKKQLDQLTLKETALLVGLPKAPSSYNPTKNYERSLTRANRVLSRLKSLGWIDTIAFTEAFNERPTVYKQSRTQNKAPYVIDYLKYLTKDNIADLETGGYQFTLSIDMDIQNLARETLIFGYNQIRNRSQQKALEKYGEDFNMSKIPQIKTLNGAIVSMDSSTGDVLALVGGVNYKKSNFNRAFQAFRQPGSSIKPFIYQIALNNGYGLNSKLIDITRTYEYIRKDVNLTWRPKNYSNNVKGLITLRDALIYSKNLATINLVTDLGLDVIFKGLKEFGFQKVPYDLSISLGSFGVSPLQMAEFYSIFTNDGQKVQARFIKQVSKPHQSPIVLKTVKTPIMSPQQAYLMSHILQEVVKRGSGKKAYLNQIQLAGKTGTTNDNTDAWFAGFSPSIQTVIWYGNDSSKPMDEKETGGQATAPTFKYFYERLIKLYPHLPRKFTKPKGVFFKDGFYFTKQSPLEQTIAPPKNNLVF